VQDVALTQKLRYNWVLCGVPPNLGKITNMYVNPVKGKIRGINRVYNIG
tara:strand:+ start:342 stop:488 length:147 start_codon:yes stop_codon:yes gene_type:complete